MESEFYVAEDGSIHRHSVTVVNKKGNPTNSYAPVSAVNAQSRTVFRPIHQVSEVRKVWFWIVSIVISLLIAVGVIQGFGTEVYGSDGGFAATIGPFVVFIGALAGSIFYGIFCAKFVDYNLCAFILSALSSVGGIIAAGIAVAIVCFVAMILFYTLITGLVIAVICIIIGGS